jgi:hypothetical protein
VRLVDRALDGAFLAGMTHSHALDNNHPSTADPSNSRSAHHA